MKHPVDTSTWGEFKVGELFETNGKKTFTGASVNKNKLSDGGTPRITVTEKNNGIYGYYSDIDDINYRVYDKFISVSFLGTVFWHNYRASVDMKVHVLTKIKNVSWSDNIALFLITSIKKGISKFSYSDQLSANKLYELEIKLPLKHGTNSADYSQDDIDWDYMEVFMSRVQNAAKERLANLPEPGQKSKTPVDVSKWGEFKVGELFDMFPGRRLKTGDFEDGDIPFVMASSYNNGVVTTLSNPISTNKNFLTADIFGNVFYQKELVGYGDDNCGLKLKYRDGRPNEYLFFATMISSISVHASFTNKLRGSWYIEQAIQLPLKQGTNLFDYTQDDIDWDYMESFMSQFKNLAKNRVERLTSAHDCDILTV